MTHVCRVDELAPDSACADDMSVSCESEEAALSSLDHQAAARTHMVNSGVGRSLVQQLCRRCGKVWNEDQDTPEE
jgi:hypothetical protein